MRGVWYFAFWILMAIAVAPAWAQRPPETHPVSDTRSIGVSFDRAALPADLELWGRRTVLGHSADLALGYGQIHLTCSSASSAEHGRCPTIGEALDGTGVSTIPLSFTERRSGMKVELDVTGSHERIGSTRSCSTDFWVAGERPLWRSVGGWCVEFEPPAGTGAQLRLAATELGKLVAGRWDAKLELHLRADPAGPVLATYTFIIELEITDRDRVSIYFPEYDQATPHVGLNVKYNPVSTPSLSGRRDLDMCLYDGLGSQSPYLEISVTDTGRPAPGRPPERFSVWNAAAVGSDERDRLDYTVTLRHAGVPIRMQNGRLEPLNGIDSAELRLVVLPGMSLPVYCVPTPLTLEVPRVDASSKTEGYYQGNLTIVLNVPTGTP
jgi:hypothetical protein